MVSLEGSTTRVKRSCWRKRGAGVIKLKCDTLRCLHMLIGGISVIAHDRNDAIVVRMHIQASHENIKSLEAYATLAGIQLAISNLCGNTLK